MSSGQKRHLGHRYTSSHPGNCFYPLRSSNDSIQHHTDSPCGDHYRGSTPPNASAANLQLQQDSSRTAMLKGGAKAWPNPDKAAFWSCGGAGKAGLVSETASGGSSEAQEDGTPSPYDNLDRVSLCQTVKDAPVGKFDSTTAGSHNETCEPEAEQAGGSSSSWSSCEVLPLDEGGDDVGPVNLEDPTKTPERLPSRQEVEQENADENKHGDNRDHNMHHPNSWASCSVLSVSPLSTGSSEVFLPSGPPDLKGPELYSETRNNHSVVVKMRQQMAQQKAEYQRKIER